MPTTHPRTQAILQKIPLPLLPFALKDALPPDGGRYSAVPCPGRERAVAEAHRFMAGNAMVRRPTKTQNVSIIPEAPDADIRENG